METREAAAADQGTGPCLIAGCGYAGARLARRLAGTRPLRALVRSEAAATALSSEGLPARAVNFDGEALSEAIPAPTAIDALVYLVPPPDRGTTDPRLARFLAALGEARPRVLLYVSTTGIYGDAGGRAVNEQTPPAPREDRSRRRLDAEGQVAAWCAERGTRCVVFRVPGIYGPWRLPLDRIRIGEPVLRAEDSGPGNRIQVDDLVAAAQAALERPVTGPYNITDGCPESMAAFTRRVAVQAGLPAPPEVTWAEAAAVLSPGLLAFLRESRVVLNDRMLQDLGIHPRPPEAGIRASLREMGRLGWW